MQVHKRSIKVFGAAILAVLAIGAGLAIVRNAGATPPPGATASTGPRVQTELVRIGSVASYVHGVGRIVSRPSGTVDVSFPQAGRIARVDVRIGEPVVAGQELASLDVQPLALAAAQAQGALAAADASASGRPAPVLVQERAAAERLAVARQLLQRAERLAGSRSGEISSQQALILQGESRVRGDQTALSREQVLLKGGVAARKDVEAVQQQLALDQAALAADRAKVNDPLLSARQAYSQALTDAAAASIAAKSALAGREQSLASLALAQASLANGILRSPISGVITAVNKSSGEWANAGDAIARVINPRASELLVSVPADEAEGIATGDPVRVGGAVGRVLHVVRPLDPVTQMAQVTVVFWGRAPAQIGSALPAEIRTGVRRGVTIVPVTAVVQDPSTQAYTVFAKDRKGQFAPIIVKLGWTEGKWEQVYSKQLRAGTLVATYGSYELLAAGQ